MVSLDGAPPRVVRAPDGADVGQPVFEPAGGLARAIFVTATGKTWLASADGTRDWTEIAASAGYCEWFERTAVCEIAGQLVAATDDGKRNVPLAANPAGWWTSVAGRVYYVGSGGLFVIDLPAPSP